MYCKEQILTTKMYNSPCGELILGSLDGALCLCDWLNSAHNDVVMRRIKRMEKNVTIIEGEDDILTLATEQLDEYFAKERKDFTLPLHFIGTDFQISVWRQLQSIPYGVRLSYGDFARQLGREKGVRAVAAAIGANGVSIFVPCHRVVGADGSLVGYAGGLEAKAFLVGVEG